MTTDVFNTKEVINRIQAKGFNHTQIAKLAGVSPQTVRSVAQSKNEPTITTAKRLAALDSLVNRFMEDVKAVQKL